MPNEGCTVNYIGRKIKHIDHINGNKFSNLLEHEKCHTHVWESDFKIIGNNYQSNYKRKVTDFLFIKQLKPTLNFNETSIILHLFY